MRGSETLLENRASAVLPADFAPQAEPLIVLITPRPAHCTLLAEQWRRAGLEVQIVPADAIGHESVQRPQPALVLADDQLDEDELRQVYRELRHRRSLLLVLPLLRGGVPEAKLRGLVAAVAGVMSGGENDRPSQDQRVFRSLTMDRARMSVTLGELAVVLTPTEFRLLWALIEQPGYVLSREQLLSASHDSSTNSRGRTVDAHIRTIRRKLHPYGKLIETVRGIGYRLREFHWPEEAPSPEA